MFLNLIDSTAQMCGQWLENVDRTHLVLANGKLVQQKKQRQIKAADCNVLEQPCRTKTEHFYSSSELPNQLRLVQS